MVVPLFAIAAGASLVSGLLSRSSAKKQAKKEEAAIRRANDEASAAAAQMNKQIRARADAAALVPVQTEREHFGATASAGNVDMPAFLAAAERGGFNPLTFLRSGALSLFAQTQTEEYTDDWTCTTGERAMDAALSGTYLPQLSPVIGQTSVPGMGDVFGNALTTGANQYLADANQQKQNAFQMDLMKAALSGVGARGSYSGSRSGYVPAAFLNGSVARGPSALSTGGFDPGLIKLGTGTGTITGSPIKQPANTYEDLMASLWSFGRDAKRLVFDPDAEYWRQRSSQPSAWSHPGSAWSGGAVSPAVPTPTARPGPVSPANSWSWRDFSSSADDWINRQLMGH